MKHAGIYVHYPFCERLCPYCDFAVKIRKVIPEKEYTDAVLREIQTEGSKWANHEFKTLYFGGGTPSLWSGAELARVLGALDETLTLSLDEITIEANPQDVTIENLEKWRDLGIGRVSLGVQSFSDPYLRALGRNHDGKKAIEALEKLNSFGFSISADLIFAGPGQTLESFSTDVETMSRYVDHISAYALTIEENTQFWKRQKEGRLALPESDKEDAFFDLRDQKLSEKGFDRYEVSSFSRGLENRAIHNSGYWLGRPYLGLGIGAHSFVIGDGFQRLSNTRGLKEYYSNPAIHRTAEKVFPVDHWFERMFLIARTRFWFSPKAMFKEFGALKGEILDSCEAVFDSFDDRYIEKKGDAYRLTSLGLDISDSIGKALAEKIQ